ncbi:MAG: hypothetical protein NZ561_01585, partial [Phycisphaerae bacterium]|nr:hypothetical protein [Phycisphaerae bacterium]MDW8261654.1 hypothetical protein [Phycisphaerales bacterium]
MIHYTCSVCRAQLAGEDAFAGKEMRCPNCHAVQRVPMPAAVAADGGTPSPAPAVRKAGASFRAGSERRYGFN